MYEVKWQFDQAKLEGDARRDARQQYAAPILNTFEAWLKKEQPHVLPKSPIGKAFTYTMNQWAALNAVNRIQAFLRMRLAFCVWVLEAFVIFGAPGGDSRLRRG